MQGRKFYEVMYPADHTNPILNRLQILFDEKPDEDTRKALKSNGFRWSPKNGAWQRQLTDNAIRAAKTALHIQ